MPGRLFISLFIAAVLGCAPKPVKMLPDTDLASRPLPLLDQGIPEDLATATFALG
jgi:hypothetical protein